MADITTGDLKQETELFKKSIYSWELQDALAFYAEDINILSLDCFDTLLWRHTATPTDLFYDLQDKPNFKRLNINARGRISYEALARRKSMYFKNSPEVTLRDIYLSAFDDLDEASIEALTEEELACEQAALYAFPPIVALIRKAYALGLTIIIVSDTYFNEQQLRRFLSASLPKEVFGMIAKIYCSSDYGQGKTGDLFNIITKELKQLPQDIFHVGDNFNSDFIFPLKKGLKTALLLHHDEEIMSLQRMQIFAASIIDKDFRRSKPAYQLYAGLLSAAKMSADPVRYIGYVALGPIMHAFGQFICDELRQMIQSGKKIKVLFLMRDAHLPFITCQAMWGAPLGSRISISRFSAFASSFRRKEDVIQYLEQLGVVLKLDDLCKQLLIPKELAKELCMKAYLESTQPQMAFFKLILEEEVLAVIFEQSRRYRERLKKYLIREGNIEAGDTVVLVDLGYTGTAQVRLSPILLDEMGVKEVVGRYLLTKNLPGDRFPRKGLFDLSWCDDNALSLVVSYISLLEQLSTVPNDEGCVDEYDEEGRAIVTKSSYVDSQSEKLALVQNQCLEFIEDAMVFFSQIDKPQWQEYFKSEALHALTRLIFFPSKIEIDYLQSFDFEMGLGTDTLIRLWDYEKGYEGLRRRGLFYMEQNIKSMRMNYPAELRSAGIEMVLPLMLGHMAQCEIVPNDLSLRREKVLVAIFSETDAMQEMMEAKLTYDGYFSLMIPLGFNQFDINIQFGFKYRWVQIEAAEIVVAANLYGNHESILTEDASDHLLLDKMVNHQGGLYECTDRTGMIIYLKKDREFKNHRILRVVFRPIVVHDDWVG